MGREGRGKQRVSHSDAGQARGHRAGRGWDGTSCPPAGLGDSPPLPGWSLREPGLRACAVGGPGPPATGAAPRGARPQRALDPRPPQLGLSRRPGPTSRMGTRWQKPIFPPSRQNATFLPPGASAPAPGELGAQTPDAAHPLRPLPAPPSPLAPLPGPCAPRPPGGPRAPRGHCPRRALSPPLPGPSDGEPAASSGRCSPPARLSPLQEAPTPGSGSHDPTADANTAVPLPGAGARTPERRPCPAPRRALSAPPHDPARRPAVCTPPVRPWRS